MKAVGYCRFSSDMQRDGYSIEAQKNAILKYCKDNNIQLIQFYIDEAFSGTNDNRPSFQEMIKNSETKTFEYVIVHKLDRFSRNKFDSAIYKKKLRDNGIKLISVLENLDNSPESIILESLLEGMSEYYSKNLSREVKKGQRIAASKGLVLGPKVAFGYKKEKETKKILVDEKNKDIVIKIFELKASGERTIEIFRYLRNIGVDFKHHNRVRDIIKNKIYKGVYSYAKNKENADEFLGVVEPIVSEELWNKANAQIGKYERKRTNTNLLSGKLFCDECGAHLNATSNKTYRYYICRNRLGKYSVDGNIVSSCSSKFYRSEDLEKNILENIKRIFEDEQFLDNIKNEINKINQQEVNVNELNISKNQLEKVNKKLNNLIDLRVSGEIDKVEYSKRYKELIDNQSLLQIKINNLEINDHTIDINIDEIKKIFNSIFNDKNNDSEVQYKLINLLVDKIIIKEDSYTIYYKFDDFKSSKYDSLRNTSL